MANPTAKKKAGKRLGTRIHRWAGTASLLIVLIVAVTGILLNHAEGLKLNETRITSALILRHYGIEPGGQPTVFKADNNLLALWDGQLIFNSVIVDTVSPEDRLVAAGEVLDGEFTFVLPELIIVCDAAGGLLDRLDEASLPAGRIRRAGAGDGNLKMEMEETGERFRLSGWTELTPETGSEPEWFTAVAGISDDELDQLAAAFRGEGLPLSRIILDLHSGRFFGVIGVVLYDLAAVILIVLGITGVQLWFRRR